MIRRFKGTPTEYRTLHQWVAKNLGKPQECWHCGTTEVKRYEWANIPVSRDTEEVFAHSTAHVINNVYTKLPPINTEEDT